MSQKKIRTYINFTSINHKVYIINHYEQSFTQKLFCRVLKIFQYLLFPK